MAHQVVATSDGAIMDEFTLVKPQGWRLKERQGRKNRNSFVHRLVSQLKTIYPFV
jgi:hypothetical protein